MRQILLALTFLLVLIAPSIPAADELKPNENLVTDGVPPIPLALLNDVRRYTDFRSAHLFDWHPTSREILIGTRFAATTQVHHVRTPGGARSQITFFQEGVAAASYQPTKGEYLVFSRDVGGNERYQLYRFDLGTGDVTLLTDGKSRNALGHWSPTGDRLAYTSTKRNGRDSDLYVIDPMDPKSDRLLAELGAGWSVLDWSKDSTRLLAMEYVSINESYLWSIDAKTGEKAVITPKGGKEKVSYHDGKFTADGKALWTACDRDSEFVRLSRIDLDTKGHEVFTADIPWGVESFDVSPDGKTVAFVTNEDGIGTLRILDAATGKQKPQPKLPPGSVSGVQWHPSGKDLAFQLVSARFPTDVYSLDVASGKIERWTMSETGGLNTSKFSEPELVKWKSFDERMISGFLYRPASKFAGKRPVIVNIHGGPESQFRPMYLGAANYYLNVEGVAILYPNIRGSNGYGKTFLQLDNGFKREDSYKDIAALFDWIKGQPDLDADRVMVTGGSYGGHMTLAIATYYPERIRCAVDIVGMSNLRTFLENTEDYRRDLRRVEYGDERDPKMREFMERTAPLNNVQKITKPLFVIQGLNDPRVPASEADQMVAALKKRGTPAWYLVAKDEGHGFRKKPNVEYQAAATAAFVKRYLLGD
jgi:dipeptidyl aminopeptidase/acylaminoacyl peptidase